MIAFLCSTPFQIWNAISLSQQVFRGEPCDLYVIDHFRDAETLCGSLRAEGLFRKVQYVPTDHITFAEQKPFQRKCNRLRLFFSWRSVVEERFRITKAYDSVFLAALDEIRNFALCAMRRLSPDLKICQMEDGTADYVTMQAPATTWQQKLFYRTLGRFCGLTLETEKISTLYATEPDYLPPRNDGITLHRIPQIRDPQLIAHMNRIYSFSPFEVPEEVIFLDQPLDRADAADAIYRLLGELTERFGDKHVIVKPHPRSSGVDFSQFHTYPRQSASPFEIYLLNHDYTDKILISHRSTASCTPKFCFDQEPSLVFLYRLIPDNWIDIQEQITLMDQLVSNLKKNYRDPSRITVPTTKEELFAFLSARIPEAL